MKNNLFFIVVCVAVVWLLSGAVWYVRSLFAVPAAAELSDVEQINKYYTEQTIKSEIEYAALWEYVENMSEEEYCNTFFRVQHDK